VVLSSPSMMYGVAVVGLVVVPNAIRLWVVLEIVLDYDHVGGC